ncbi:MAG: DUF3341 domain-containing protein [Acidobacteria bacterium]|nr:DUF3341 domain-containing protein [Acidobacteriota bacterium]
MSDVHDVYGLMVEFASTDDLLAGCEQTRDAGFKNIDAFSPAPIHGLTEAIGYEGKGWIAKTVFIGGFIGAMSGFFLQYWTSAIDYPLNIGGRPYLSWPAFIPVTFEMTILLAVFAAVFGMLGWNKLPQPYHPVFNVQRFKLASSNRFFLVIESVDNKFDRQATRAFLEGLDNAVGVYDVDY